MAAQSRSRKNMQLGMPSFQLGQPDERKPATVGQSPEGPVQPASSTHRITGSGIISMLLPIQGTTNDPAASPGTAGTAAQPDAATQPVEPTGGTAVQPTTNSATEAASEAIKRRMAGYRVT